MSSWAYNTRRRPLLLGRPFRLGRLIRWCGLILICAARIASADPAGDAASRQQADAIKVEAATEALAKGGAQALAAHIAAMRDVLAHIPKGYRKIEPVGDDIHFRAESIADFAAFIAWTADRARLRGQPAPRVVQLPDTYPAASFLLAWYYNDAKEPEKAMAAADLGLAVAPREARLVGEKGQALLRLHRYEIALSLYDKVLTADDFLAPRGQALLLRAKGFTLTELRRFDEAEKAYRDSLALEPDHVLARNELAYIARLRGGGAPTPAQMTTYDKAKKGQ